MLDQSDAQTRGTDRVNVTNIAGTVSSFHRNEEFRVPSVAVVAMLRLKESIKGEASTSREGSQPPGRFENRDKAEIVTVGAPVLPRPSSFERPISTGSAHEVDSSAREVRALRGLDAVKDLRAEWEAIKTPWASPMQSHAWVRAWAEVYGVDRDLEILVTGQDRATAIAPLVRSFRGGQRLELAGPDDLGEVMDFLYTDDSSARALVDALAGTGLPIRFWRVPADSPAVAAVKNAYGRRGIVRCQTGAGIPSLPLDASWVDPERHLDKRRRSNLRRARRIAERGGPVTWEILSPKPDDVGPLLDEAYALELAGWKGRSGAPLARTHFLGEFIRRYASAAAEQGILRVCFLRIGGRAAAMKIGAITGNRFWLLTMGYSEEFEECSPGTLLLVETIRYAARSGLHSYEFLGGDEPWIRAWTQLLRPCVSLRTYPLSVPGIVALGSDASAFLRARIKSMMAAAPRLQQTIERRAALAYVAGPNLEDAIRACRSLSTIGFRSTVGYVIAPNESPRAVADRYAATIDAIGTERFDCYVSVKAPELRFSRNLFRELAERARERGVGLHFDALGPEDVDETFSLIDDIRTIQPKIGCTLPGRWRRSVADAERAIDLDLSVRVVKGEWADLPEREVAPWTGSMAVVERIAGRVHHAAIATHDASLARGALRRLRSAGTPSELEVLLGYPVRRVTPAAETEAVPVRMYVPYGTPSPPYSLSHVKENPRIAGWALRDLCTLARFRTARSPGITQRYANLKSDRRARGSPEST